MKIIMSSMRIVRLLFGCWVFGSIVLASEDPKVVEHPSDVTTVEGKDFILICVVENLPLGNDHVQWTKDGFAFGYDRNIPGFKTYSVIGDVSIGEYNLLVQNATLEDEGVYECQVRINKLRAKATVTILVPPKGPVIEDANKNGEINALAHTTNLITCRSWSGKPPGRLTWYKEGVKVEENVTYAETSKEGKLQNSSATLRIWPTEVNDGDRYECAMEADEIFEDLGMKELVASRTVELNVQKPPVASLSISPDDVKEGRQLFSRCDSYASKPPAKAFRWYLNGKVVEGSTQSSFIISDVNSTLNGAVLGCRALNDVGESEISTITLNVLYAPILIEGPKDIVTNASTAVHMSCVWDSNPPALITWYKRGDSDAVVGEGDELKVQVNDQSDAGKYVCVADAQGVASRSASARLDVLGPPIFSSPSVQRASMGGRATLNCSLESTPGISHVTWSWNRKGTPMALKNNDTRKVGNKVKFIGVMNYGQAIASLIIEDVSPDDMAEYNCTVHNAYGSATTAIAFQEQTSEAMAGMVPMIGAIVGAVVAILFLIVLVIFCVRKKRQQKSTTFPPEKESFRVEPTDISNQDNRLDPIPAHVKLISPDADSDNPSTASVSSREAVRESLEEYRGHNDDGYHTEEANSWNRHEKQSPGSSPARSTRDDYSRVNYVPSLPMTSSPRGFDRATSPYASSDVASDIANPGYLKYNLQPTQPYNQYPVQYGPNGVVELPPQMARAASPLVYGVPQQQYPPSYYHGPSSSSSGYRSAQGYPMGHHIPHVGSNAPSVVSSHRSVTPSPYVLGRATPTSVLGDRVMYPVPINSQAQIQPSSSQSSLEQAPSSIAAQDPYDNPARMSRLSSRMSQASRSTEMLSKPMTARMATHV